MFKVIYHENVVAVDIPKIAKAEKGRIRAAIESKLFSRPEVYGKPLRKSLKAYRSLRVGEYRVVYRIEENYVKILLMAHRSVVYDRALKRME